MKLNFRKVCLFWGVLDVFYIVRFIWLNVEQGRIPLIDDIASFSQLLPQQGMSALVMFTLSLLLTISIIFSAVLLLVGWGKVRFLVFAQIPLRLLLVVPSLSFAPWLLKQLHANGILLLITVLIISELLKFGSFALTRTAENAQ